jgi:hypothetical protein
MSTLTWKFRDAASQSEMLPDVEHLGFDYVNETTQHNRYDVIWTAIEGEHTHARGAGYRRARGAPTQAVCRVRDRVSLADTELNALPLPIPLISHS